MAVTLSKAQPKPVQAVAPAPVKKIQMVQPAATVTKQYQDKTETVTKEEVGGPIQAEGPQANVGVSMGLTVPTQPFGNVKFSVSLFLPCPVDVDQINETYAQAKAWVDERVTAINDEVTTQLSAE